MKYLVLFAVLFVAYLYWRAERRAEARDANRAQAPGASGASGARRGGPALAQEEMVRCEVCSLHLPRGDALPDARGARWYCCAEHQRQARTPAGGA